MTVAVTDACIFIDCYKLGCLDDLFALPYAIHTTQDVYLECDTFHPALDAHELKGRLMIVESEDELGSEFAEASKGLSDPDLTVPAYALQIPAAIILTSDAKLRKFCKQLNLVVHGSLWVFEELIICGHWSFSHAIEVAELLALRNRRAPQKLIKECCKAWSRNETYLNSNNS